MSSGKVYLVGAGPGDPKLLTLRAVEVIGAVDVLFVDQLVGPGVLDYARLGAEVIDVGKRSGCHTVVQEEIHGLLIEEARRGRTVARLKGGDPFVFGRGGEEIDALERAGIAWEVVPGVTSSLAAAAYAGIPLTHRDCASSVAFVTGHSRAATATDPLDTCTADTLVIYMGGARLSDIARRLVARGRATSTPIAIVAAASTPAQRVETTSLGRLATDWPSPASNRPIIAIVGEVVGAASRRQRA